MTETAPERCPSRPSPDTARPGRSPLVTSRRALEHRSRRQVVVGCVVLLALSQFLIAVAPDYAVVLAVCVVTVLVVTGHFTAYTYITALVRSDAGFTGLALSAVLFAYGAAGIGGIWLAARRLGDCPPGG